MGGERLPEFTADAHRDREIIEFRSKPSAEIRDIIKRAGFRWDRIGKIWWRPNQPLESVTSAIREQFAAERKAK